LEEDMEDGRRGRIMEERVRELNAETLSAQRGRYRIGMAKVSSINHDPCWHGLHDLSNTFIVLVFSELTSFVRKILQREENKGVEFTGDGNP
jgi:hypothetical protein